MTSSPSTSGSVSSKRNSDDIQQASRSATVVIVVSCVMLQFIAFGYGLGMGVLFVEVMESLQTSRTLTSLMQTVCLTLLFGGAMVIGAVVDKLKEGSAVILGGLLASVGALGASFAPNIETLIVTVGIVSGTGLCFVNLASIVAINSVLTKNKGLGLGLAIAGSGLGSAVFPQLITQLIQAYDWRGTFLILSGINLNMCFLGMIIRLLMKTVHKHDEKVEEVKRSPSIRSLTSLLHLHIFRNKSFFLFFLCEWPLWFFFNGVFVFIVDFGRTKGLDLQSASFLLSTLTLARSLGGICGGFMGSVFRVPALLTNGLSVLLYGVLSLTFAFIPGYSGFIAVLFVMGICNGTVDMSVPSIVAQMTDGTSYTFALSYLYGVGGIPDLLISPFSGAIRDATGDYAMMFYITAAAMTLLGISLTLLHVRFSCCSDRIESSVRPQSVTNDIIVTHM